MTVTSAHGAAPEETAAGAAASYVTIGGSGSDPLLQSERAKALHQGSHLELRRPLYKDGVPGDCGRDSSGLSLAGSGALSSTVRQSVMGRSVKMGSGFRVLGGSELHSCSCASRGECEALEFR